MVTAANLGRGSLARAVKSTARVAIPSRRLREEAFLLVRRRMVFGAPAPPEEGFMRELRLRFKAEVEALSAYMDRDLITLWGYDELASTDS
jgi:hypothetical protein